MLLTSNMLKTERHRKVKKMGKGLPGQNQQKAKGGSINPRTMKKPESCVEKALSLFFIRLKQRSYNLRNKMISLPWTSFSKCMCAKLLQPGPTLCDPMDWSRQALLSMEFPRQEYCSGQSFPSPGDPPNSGIEPRSPALQANSLPSELPGKPRDLRTCISIQFPGDADAAGPRRKL